jgi:hypothetical protein
MTILRKRVTANFTTLPNSAIEDRRLSFRARGILAYLLAKPNGWAVRSEQIAADGREGRDAIRTALNELADFGYYRRYVARTPDGRVVTVTRISDVPIDPALPDPDEVDPSSEQPVDNSTGAGLSGAGSSGAGESGPLVKTLEQNPHKPPRGASDIPDDDPDWQRFWVAYPRKVGKGAARKAWVRALRKATVSEIMDGVGVYVDVVKTLDGMQFVQHPATWLNQERWTDETTNPREAVGGRPRNVRSTDEECPIHAGQHRDRCGGCAADARAVERPVAKSQVGSR